MSKGFFGGLFDFDGNGKMDIFESAAEFMFINDMLNDEKADEITAAGLDMDELSCMEEYERRTALEDAGLDPDDFDEF